MAKNAGGTSVHDKKCSSKINKLSSAKMRFYSVHEKKCSSKIKKLSSAKMRFFRSKIFMSQNDFWHFSLTAFIQNAFGNLILLVSSKNMLFGMHKICVTSWLKILADLQFTKNNAAPKSAKILFFSFKNIYVTKWFFTFFIGGHHS